MNLITANGGPTVDTNNVTQFQSRHELHRHFADVDGPYTRATWKDWLKVLAFYVVTTAILALAGFGTGYAWGRFVGAVL